MKLHPELFRRAIYQVVDQWQETDLDGSIEAALDEAAAAVDVVVDAHVAAFTCGCDDPLNHGAPKPSPIEASS